MTYKIYSGENHKITHLSSRYQDTNYRVQPSKHKTKSELEMRTIWGLPQEICTTRYWQAINLNSPFQQQEPPNYHWPCQDKFRSNGREDRQINLMFLQLNKSRNYWGKTHNIGTWTVLSWPSLYARQIGNKHFLNSW